MQRDSIDPSARVFNFAVSLASACRLFTLGQIARHPDLSWRSQPVKRASEFLRPYAESFDVMPGPPKEPYRWRLSTSEKRKRGLNFKSIHGVSQKSKHWLGCGDVWITLTLYGGREPEVWRMEWDGQFDIYTVWRGIPMLIEYQRTSINPKDWNAKWKRRVEWYRMQKWETWPRVILINEAKQPPHTIRAPKKTIVVEQIKELPIQLLKPPQS